MVKDAHSETFERNDSARPIRVIRAQDGQAGKRPSIYAEPSGRCWDLPVIPTGGAERQLPTEAEVHDFGRVTA